MGIRLFEWILWRVYQVYTPKMSRHLIIAATNQVFTVSVSKKQFFYIPQFNRMMQPHLSISKNPKVEL